MKKLQLDLDRLEVETFVTREEERKPGTVNANEVTVPISCDGTCDISCYEGSCAGTTCVEGSCPPGCP